MGRSSVLACLLFCSLAAGATAQADLPPEEKAKFFVQYTPTLYEACSKAKLELTLRAIQSLDMVHHFSNPLLAVTFLALDDEAWQDLARTARGMRINKMFSDSQLIKQILQAHTIDYPIFTNYWPREGSRHIDTMLQGRGIQLTMGNSSSSGGGGARSFMVLGFQNTAELVCSSTNLRGGASVLHVLSLHKGGTQAGQAAAGQAAQGRAGQAGQAAAAGAGQGAQAVAGQARAAQAAQGLTVKAAVLQMQNGGTQNS